MGDFLGAPSVERQPTAFETIPEQGREAILRFAEQGEALSQDPSLFQPIDFTQGQQQAIQGLENLPGGKQLLPQFAPQGQFRPDFKFGQRASSAFGGVEPLIGQAGQRIDQGTRAIGAEEIGVGISAFRDPFEEQVVQSTFADIRDEQARQASDIAGQASSRGAFGGTRQALLESELGRSTQRELGFAGGRLRSQGQQLASQLALQNLQSERQRFLQGAGIDVARAGTQLQLGQGLFGARQGVQNIQSQRQADAIRNVQARQTAQAGQAQGALAAGDLQRQLELAQQQVPLQQQQAFLNAISPFTGIIGGGGLQQFGPTGLLGSIESLTRSFANTAGG